MKATRVPGYFFYQGEDGKYYRPLTEVTIDLNGNEVSPRKQMWEEVDCNEEKNREDWNGRMMGKCVLDMILKMQKEEPEKWAEIEKQADQIRSEKESKRQNQ